MIFYGGTIYIPNSYDIYCVLIVELIQKLIELDKPNTNYNEIKSILKLLEYFFEDERNRDFINNELPVDSNGQICSFKNSIISNYHNPLIIFLTNFNTNRIKYNIISIWEKNGGIYDSVCGNVYLIKRKLVFLINELEKNISSIDKNYIKDYLSDTNSIYTESTLYKLLPNELKIKLHTFMVYTIIKNNLNISDPNKIHQIDKNEFIKMDYYFKLGIDLKLLKSKEINRIYNGYQIYWEQIPNSELNSYIIIEYENYLGLQKIHHEVIKIKMKIINMRYQEYIFNTYLSNSSEYKDEIISIYDYLTENDYKFTKEQQDKINLLIDKIKINQSIPYEFDLNMFEPIISSDELISLKNKILENKNNLCEIIKNIYPHYNISPDIFTKNKYSNQEIINKTIYFYCAIILIVGYINWKLVKYKQDYIIITKGGKALQFLLSKLSKSNTNIKINSNDIDLMICPNDLNNFNPEKNRYLGIIICLLIQWILNPTNNIYSKDYSISCKMSEKSDPYPYIIKLSHKIQNSDNETNFKYIAITDIDYNKIMYKEFYSKLIYDQINNNELFPNLLYIYQNLSDFILEKIYYINQNYKLLRQINNLEQHKNLIINEIDSINILITNCKEQIDNCTSQLKNNNKSIKNNDEKINILSKNLENIKLQLENITPHQNNYLILQKQINQINNEITTLSDEKNNLAFFNNYNKQLINKLQDKIYNWEIDINELNISLRLIDNDINKNLSDKNNYIRFINKFLEQIKNIIKIMFENKQHNNNQIPKSFIKNIIDENSDFLKFNENDYMQIINLIFD